jgi:hypothetical protein
MSNAKPIDRKIKVFYNDYELGIFESEHLSAFSKMASDGVSITIIPVSEEVLPGRSDTDQLIIELIKRWDGLGKYKDDDFGEVAEIMEMLKNKFLKSIETKGGV